MTQKKPSKTSQNPEETREDRLKSALKANLARRKAQMRAKAAQSAGVKPAKSDADPGPQAE